MPAPARCGCWLNLLAAPADGPYPFPPPGELSPYCYACWKASQPVELFLVTRPRDPEPGGPGTPPAPPPPPVRKGLGDAVAWVLKRVGVTPERWSRVLGAPCNCRSRQARLNRWGWRVWDRVRSLGRANNRG